jgi:TRAP-type C4-dicarboxylate transport system substrate-binding protein
MKHLVVATLLAATWLLGPREADAQAPAPPLPAVSLKVAGGNRTQNMFRNIYGPFFTRDVTERSGGAITTTFGSIEELGIRGPEVLRLLRLGMFDIAEGTLSYMAGEDPHFDGLDLPGISPDIGTQRRAAQAYRAAIARQMSERFGVRLLTMSPVALQVFYCRGRVETFQSLAGRKVRVFNRAMSDLVEAAGATTVNLPFAEVVPAMQRGVADCAITGTSAGNTARWWEVTDHLYMLPMGWSMTFFGANQRAWDRLDPRVRGFLERELAALEDRMWQQAGQDVDDGINCNAGRQPCRDGIVASPAMTIVPLSPEDNRRAQQILGERVLADWARRCGAACVREWNQTVGQVVGVQAPVP